MISLWSVKNASGEVLAHYTSTSPLEVARKVVAVNYDAFRLQVSSSYRELFERALRLMLERENWQIVRVVQARGARRSKAAPSKAAHGRAMGRMGGSPVQRLSQTTREVPPCVSEWLTY
jgi:hypothetical protein